MSSPTAQRHLRNVPGGQLEKKGLLSDSQTGRQTANLAAFGASQTASLFHPSDTFSDGRDSSFTLPSNPNDHEDQVSHFLALLACIVRNG